MTKIIKTELNKSRQIFGLKTMLCVLVIGNVLSPEGKAFPHHGYSTEKNSCREQACVQKPNLNPAPPTERKKPLMQNIKSVLKKSKNLPASSQEIKVSFKLHLIHLSFKSADFCHKIFGL